MLVYDGMGNRVRHRMPQGGAGNEAPDESITTLDGLYRVRATFFDPDLFDESDPSLEAKLDLRLDEKDYPAESSMVVEGLPVSADPRPRVFRRVYRSLTDGAELRFAQEIADSDAGTAVLAEPETQVAVGALLPTDHAAAPISRAVVATSSRMVYGGLKENGALVAPSLPFNEGAVPTTLYTPAETPDGNPVAALAEFLGNLCVYKRDAMLIGGFDGEGRLSLSRQELAVGCAAVIGVAAGEHLLAYPTEKGLYVWNGGRQRYWGEAIQGTWDLLDQEDLEAASGVFFRPRKSAFFLLRKRAHAYARTVARLELLSPAHPIGLVEYLELSALGVIDDDVGNPRLLGGTPDGTIVELETGEVAGTRAGLDPSRFVVQAASTTTTVVAPAGAFATVGDGPVGARLRIQAKDGRKADTWVARVNGVNVEVQPALPFAPAAGDEARLGLYPRRWRSKRMNGRLPGRQLWWHDLDLAFPRRQNEEFILRCWSDYHDDSPIVKSVPMEAGFYRLDIFRAGKGRYFQWEIEREDGPWSIYEMVLRVDEVDIRG